MGGKNNNSRVLKICAKTTDLSPRYRRQYLPPLLPPPPTYMGNPAFSSRRLRSISFQVRCPSTSMPRVTDMVRSLSPLVRLDEMHSTLAKFSIPQGGQQAGVGAAELSSSPSGLTLSKAFEVIEARKEELEVCCFVFGGSELSLCLLASDHAP